MMLFWKIFAAVLITFVGVISTVSFLITDKQISDAESHLVERFTSAGGCICREIEHYSAESRWPFDALNSLTKQPGFLFWWVVRDNGVIHLADKAEMMETYAPGYFPQVKPSDSKEQLVLDQRKNYGLFIRPLEIGKKKWTFWLGFSLTEIGEIKKQIILLSFLVSLAAVLGLGGILYVVIKHFMKPFGDLTQGALSIGGGNLSHRVEVGSRDELGQLADAFNKMATDLQATTVSRDFVDSILNTMSGALIVLDAEANIIATNRAACRILGYDQGELLGASMTKIFGHEAPPATIWEKLIEAGELSNLELSYQTKDGRQVPMLFCGRARRDEAGRISDIVSVAIDISQSKRAESALVESERRFRDIAEHSAEWIWEVDRDGKYTYVSPVVEKLLGYRPEELWGKHFYDLFHPEDREDLKQGAFRFFSTKSSFREFITRNITEDGGTVWISSSGVPILGEAGELRGYRGAAIDITARRQAEEALQASEHFLADIFDSIQDGITIMDLDYNILRVNASMEQRFSQAMPLVGKKCYEVFLGADHPCKVCLARQTIETGETTMRLLTVSSNEEGGPGWHEIYTFPLLDATNRKINGVIEYSRDITKQKQAEEALHRSEENLRHSQKMEAIGRLAGGVAHDFNNILTAIIGYAELMQMKFDFSDPRLKYLEEVRKAAERAASLTRQLLAFSRKQIFSPRVLDLNELLTYLDKMLRRLISEDIDLVTVPGGNLGEVMADPGQIEQVILNLVVNARDAMPTGGVITIETQNVTLDAEYTKKHEDLSPGAYVMLAVSDTGQGLDEASRTRIFEPFFTTKEMGKGTGLGLSTVHGIVKQSGGHITVYSEVGQGTTFKIYLPRLSQVVEEATVAPASCPLDRGSETILLVEDEDMVRQVAQNILAMKGYTVLEAASGREALQVSQQTPGPIHLVLTDVVMPGMSGRELAEGLKAQRPEIKILFMSGHTENSIVHHGVLDHGVSFIQKPFRQEELVYKVREVLEQSTGAA